MKKILVLMAVMCFMAGCVTTDPRVSVLEEKVAKLEKRSVMEAATRAGANFYPASGALTGGGTGALDKITTTGDKDAAIVMFNDEATWGNAFMPYTLDVDGGGTEAVPYLIDSGDGGNEDWELVDVYGRKLFGHVQIVTDTNGCTVGSDCDGALVRVAWGGIILMTGAGTVTLPEIVATSPAATQVDIGASICIINRDDNEQLVVDVHANDSITLNGTKDTAGDSIQNTVDADDGGGDFVCLVAVEADNWMVMGYKGTWTAN